VPDLDVDTGHRLAGLDVDNLEFVEDRHTLLSFRNIGANDLVCIVYIGQG
jgi:hypothetical protein